MSAPKPFSKTTLPLRDFSETTTKTSLANVFYPRDCGSLNEYMLFIAYFNYIPNFIIEKDINCKSANEWFQEHFKGDIKEEYFNRYQWASNKDSQIGDHFYFIDDDLMVNFSIIQSQARFFFKKTDQAIVESLVGKVNEFRNCPELAPQISLIIQTRHGIDLESIEITQPSLSIDNNYNDDFLDINKLIVNRLSNNKNKGLVLLHGKPGTGKTSYIRHLVTIVKKKVIFLSANMAASITDPGLITVLIENPNSILVIEDAENIIVDRNNDGNSPVSVLLNLTDGLLADCLHIQIICSFNTDLSRIDSALLRKGRLIAKYEFKELEVFKAQALSDSLGFTSKIHKPATLSELYNQDEANYAETKSRARIGFSAILQS